jgi:AcrR family transcriptional regulator
MESASRSHTPKGKKSREHILAAAERQFAAHGFHGTSMRDVADAADVPVAGVVYHFGRKEALYAAVLTEIAQELERDLGLERLGEGAPFPAVDASFYVTQLDDVVLALVHWADERPDRVRLLLREIVDNPSRVARAEKLPLAPVLTSMSAFIQAGSVAGVFRVETPEIAVLHIVGAVSYVVAARPTVRRILGVDPSKAYAREAVLFARQVVGLSSDIDNEVPHGSKHRDRPRTPRARTHRRADDRR